MSSGAAWGGLLLLSILLILGGIQGSSGRMLAVMFAPAILAYDTGVTADLIEDPKRGAGNATPPGQYQVIV